MNTTTEENTIPTGLKLGRNRVIENGKTVRIDVKRKEIGDKIPKIVYKVSRFER